MNISMEANQAQSAYCYCRIWFYFPGTNTYVNITWILDILSLFDEVDLSHILLSTKYIRYVTG